MQISKINVNPNFKSGLNKNIIQNCSETSISDVKMFLKQRNIESDFQSCQTIAFLTQKAVGLIETLKKKTGAKLFNFLIPSISVYTLNKLVFDFHGTNFCIPETQNVFANEKSFLTGSIFFEKNDNLEKLNAKLDESYEKNERSSSHYLSPIIHEFMHNVYLNYIYAKYGYEGECKYTKEKFSFKDKQNIGLTILHKLQLQTFNEKENNIIKNTIGKYATEKPNQYHEVFAETFTKLICDSLSNNGNPEKNPLDLLKNLNPNFIEILSKVFI